MSNIQPPATAKEKAMIRDCGITPKGAAVALRISRVLAPFFEEVAVDQGAWDLASLVSVIARSTAADRFRAIRTRARKTT